jgi:predicted AlkP superfamily pyrophosphatase or phosphodiesterase
MKKWVLLAALSAVYFTSCYNKSRLAQVELPVMEYEPHTYDSAFVFADHDYDYTPRLVIGITVDQMRYEYLTRFDSDLYLEEGGFQRLMHEGVSIENLHFNYVPTYTGPGHASIFTGTTPAYHGIIANDWYDKKRNALQYCAKDTNVVGVGTNSEAGKMSPVFLKTTTLGDEIKLANPNSKVIGISLKDRGAILPAGRSADAAYWYVGGQEDTWATSSWYGMKELPMWVRDFNGKERGKHYLAQTWSPLYADSIYNESLPDNNPYELPFKGTIRPVFPYNLAELAKLNGQYDLIKANPFGNTMTKEFAIAAIEGEKLGQDNDLDMLCLSFSATDYVGHQFGPHSKESQDTYLRLNADLNDFINYLDSTIGRNHYLIFLSADHGAANNPSMMMDEKMAAGYFVSDKLEEMVENKLIAKYGSGDWVINESNHNIFLNCILIEQKKLSLKSIQEEVAMWTLEMEGVHTAFTHAELSCAIEREGLSERVQLGFDQAQSGDVIYMLKSGWIEYGKQGTTHGSGYDYDTHVPFIMFGNWVGVYPFPTVAKADITDIAATISSILKINRPSGCIGKTVFTQE